tara:strand:- start:2760 stop:3083 length:324 start_codon:yes stop_codon:yes gene_type:complete
MTINFSQGEGTPVDLLAFSENLYLEAAADLKQAVLNAGKEPPGDGKAVITALKELRTAFHTVMEERNKLEKYRRQAGAGAAGTELDLDAARLEIGRRLALLRNVSDG